MCLREDSLVSLLKKEFKGETKVEKYNELIEVKVHTGEEKMLVTSEEVQISCF